MLAPSRAHNDRCLSATLEVRDCGGGGKPAVESHVAWQAAFEARARARARNDAARRRVTAA